MRLAIQALAVLAVACTSVRAFPQQTAPPNGTSPATTPVTTPAPSCEADCRFRPPYFWTVSWYTNEVTENITYATVITIINTVRNTTRYVTSTVDLPDGYTLPPTNEAGTRLCSVIYNGTMTTIPFPSVIGDYGSTYSWSGRLPTTRANATGTICSDSGGEAVTFRSHPDFNAFWSSYTTMPPKATGPVYGDPRGLNWECMRQDAAGSRDDFISSHFTDEAAFSLCLPEDWAPVLTGKTAAFLTTTSVSYEGDGETTTPESAHIETSVPVQVPTPTDVTSTAHTEESAEVTPPTDATSTAHTEESADVTPPDETSAPGFAHTELPAPVQPPSLSITTVFPTAHTELPQTLDEPEPTTVPPTEVGTVIKPPSGTTTAGDGGIGGVIGSLIGSYLSNGGAPPTNIPAQPAQSAVVNPPAGTPAPPSTNIPVGTTSVAVVPTAIPTIIAGTSTTIPAVVVGSTTLTAGQTTVIDNTPISVPTTVAPAPQDGQQNNQLPQPPAVVIGGSSTVTLPTAAPAAQSPSPPALTIGDQTIQPSGTAYIISGQTVSPGTPITLGTGPSATVIALTTNAAGSPIVIVGSSTIPYTTPAITGAPPIVPLSPLTLADGQTIVAASGSAAYVIAGQTLFPGGAPITVAGTTYALTTDAAGQTIAVANGAVIQTVAPAATAAVAATAQTTSAPPLVIYGTTIQPVDGTAYVYDGQTLTLGGTVTVGGDAGSSKTTLVLTTNAAGQTVVVQTVGGTRTTATATASRGSSTSSGLGGLINSGLGGTGGATAAASSTGAAAVVGVDGGWLGAVLGLLVAVV
ncbi:Mucin-2-like [Lasiodiplodia theobromae]|uniref:Mucin-2-like n=1 Tax=Lasiodiplodia theobromae TaxID=45133 RepID=UPI0015C3DFE3|nr:Mucin-2-like [Lasiodiplodia theobromae]KAF4540810.1 Mucin-2-like [Lasiodiplodia theobromae]